MKSRKERTEELISASPGTMISLNGRPFVRCADREYLTGYYFDVLSGETIHASYIGYTNTEYKYCYGSEIQW